tara:strand:+ start:1698 stop:2543 length:846 start_codon:yes stop_codon:yes gene_type:complete
MFKVYLLSLFSLLIFVSAQAETISFKNALDQKKVKLTISVNENSTHYHSPFSISIRNVSNQKQSLILDNGTLLIPDDIKFQNFIITEEQIIVLEPNRSKNIQLKAMCIEQSDMAPITGTIYQVLAKANNQLCKLSSFVEDNQKFEPAAQFLMWDIAQKMYKEDELDKIRINELGALVVVRIDENGIEVVVEPNIKPIISQRELRVNGNFSMNLVHPKKIHIAMFTMENILVKELYNNPNMPIGLSKMEYAFNSLEYPEEKYQIKLVVDGIVVIKSIVTMSI